MHHKKGDAISLCNSVFLIHQGLNPGFYFGRWSFTLP